MLCENQNILKQQQFTELKDQKSRSTINHVGPTLNLLHSDYFPEINYAEKKAEEYHLSALFNIHGCELHIEQK